MEDSTDFFEFVNNENPYAFLRNYADNSFKNPKIKDKLDALQKIQPSFVPCIVDQTVFANERTTIINFIIRNGINENIMNGTEILNKNNIEHDIGKHEIVNQSGTLELRAKAADLKDLGFDTSYVHKRRYNITALNTILEVFKNHIELDGMEDIILNIFRLKLINKQKLLRDKVFTAVNEKLDNEAVLKIDLQKEIIDDQMEEARQLLKLEKS
ncbi:hypothetical protein NCER_100650 [Vairimorpha ceranae BRL01]|uniref:Uncharacterized protein n=2 Tax=Vairimorpha ceranae TaxID=40302 RepID=C4V845_VAIC1|nr:hypothetical protein AAJ76_700036386 [Vairimorpha ceranae]EEQ82612.1 hypothetical protein NCER_100650 [Vairimorpha ceranae BRL01]KAF5141215.1 hypothetical protein G9O61_00g005320 [Vairimorpha ceranae]KKO76066.1 hypothetical protein AAJ76_700036386 [Vairimorpha ceranae]